MTLELIDITLKNQARLLETQNIVLSLFLLQVQLKILDMIYKKNIRKLKSGDKKVVWLVSHEQGMV